MRKILPLSLILILATSCQQGVKKNTDSNIAVKKPNILLVMVDDMGWTDIEPYGGEIHTPNLSDLGGKGVLFTDSHASVSWSEEVGVILNQ